MERFKIGQKVRATVNAQGLRDGQVYEVTDATTVVTGFGGFTTYEVWDAEQLRMLSVGNGHLVLTEVA